MGEPTFHLLIFVSGLGIGFFSGAYWAWRRVRSVFRQLGYKERAAQEAAFQVAYHGNPEPLLSKEENNG